MVRVYIDMDELYPYYYLEGKYRFGVEVELTDEELVRVCAAADEFIWAQDLLAAKSAR